MHDQYLLELTTASSAQLRAVQRMWRAHIAVIVAEHGEEPRNHAVAGILRKYRRMDSAIGELLAAKRVCSLLTAQIARGRAAPNHTTSDRRVLPPDAVPRD